jgi:hypothetical protein
MTPADDGGPVIAPTARGLGARVPEDISPDAAGEVSPGTGGMSVSPGSVWNLPGHRRPRTMGRGSTGHAFDAVYVTTPQALIPYTLSVREDPASPATHAFVEPASRRPLASYQQGLGDSRPAWRKVQS